MRADVDDRYPLRADGAQRLRRDRRVVEVTGAYESCEWPAFNIATPACWIGASSAQWRT